MSKPMTQTVEPAAKSGARPTAKNAAEVLRERYLCMIGGEMVAAISGRTFPTLNPATGEKLADVPACGPEDVNRAVEAAHVAFPSWRKLTPRERAVYCRRFAEKFRARSETYAMLDTLDL